MLERDQNVKLCDMTSNVTNTEKRDELSILKEKYPNTRKYHAFSPDHIDGSVVEFCGHDIDFDTNKYELEGIKIINEK